MRQCGRSLYPVGTGEGGEVAAVNRSGQAWHSGDREGCQAGWRLSIAVGRHSIESEVAAVTHNPDSQW